MLGSAAEGRRVGGVQRAPPKGGGCFDGTLLYSNLREELLVSTDLTIYGPNSFFRCLILFFIVFFFFSSLFNPLSIVIF